MNLEGEIRISRVYDKQEVLLGVNKPGMFTGEIPLLLGAPWHANVRVSKPARLFRLDQEGFWHMLGTRFSGSNAPRHLIHWPAATAKRPWPAGWWPRPAAN